MAIINNFPTGTTYSNTTATEVDVLKDKKFYKADGTLAKGAIAIKTEAVNIEDIQGKQIPWGYYNGLIKAQISETEKNKIIPENIKKGVTLLGIEGNYEPGISQATGVSAGVSDASGYIATLSGSLEFIPKNVAVAANGTKKYLFYTWNEETNEYEAYQNDILYTGKYTLVYDTYILITFETPFVSQNVQYIAYSN